MAESGSNQAVEATAKRDTTDGARSVSVVTRDKKLNSGTIVWVGLGVIATVIVLLVVEMLLQIKLRELRSASPDSDTVELLQWSDVAAYVLIGTFVLPPLIAFFGFYLARGEMRDAIAGSFLIAFIVILALGLELSLGTREAVAGSLRSLLVTNFMNLVGTVALFYFGSEAVIRASEQYSASRVGVAVAASEVVNEPRGQPIEQ